MNRQEGRLQSRHIEIRCVAPDGTTGAEALLLRDEEDLTMANCRDLLPSGFPIPLGAQGYFVNRDTPRRAVPGGTRAPASSPFGIGIILARLTSTVLSILYPRDDATRSMESITSWEQNCDFEKFLQDVKIDSNPSGFTDRSSMTS